MSTTIWWQHILWIMAAGGLGFGLTVLFSAWLRLPRHLFLIPYVGLTAIFLSAYVRWSGIDVGVLLADNWAWGLLAGLLVSVLLIANVRTQPASRQAEGGELLFDLAWSGLAYGLVDGLFLNVMPVVAVLAGFDALGLSGSWPLAILTAVVALLASLFVALAYHAGYPEFRNRSIWLVLVGNGLITLAYLFSGNPLGAIVAHVVMHLAAVLRGPETTLQLPPHLPVTD
jgi:hypothetical protein